MSNLAIIKNDKAVTSSLIVAEQFEKQHGHILRDIEELKKDLSSFGEMFIEGNELDSYNRPRKIYYMNRDGFSLLAMGFTGSKALTFKMDFIQAFNFMEAELNSPEKIMARALRIADETINNYKMLTAELQPKADFFDAVADSKSAIELGTAANVLGIKGIGRNKLFYILREKKILKDNNEPYREYIDRGYFRTIEQKYSKPDGTICISIKTLVYQRGLDFIRKMLN